MRCPFCSYEEDKVVDSRTTKEGKAVRRRRECLKCGKRFTTYEYVETVPLTVVKSDGKREAYDRDKLMAGVYTACKKLPIAPARLQEAIEAIETEISRTCKDDVPSHRIGELVLAQLKEIDEIAYMRFASVYRNFSEVAEFLSEIQEMTAPVEPLVKVR